MRLFLAFISALLVIGFTVPYAIDIYKGRVRPARASRIMFVILLVVALFQQHDLHSGYALSLTIGEAVSSIMLLLLALKHGVGGLRRLDLLCYGVLFIDILIWQTTKSTLFALHLTAFADLISFWPTLHKTWHDHKSETTLFYWGGAIAPLFAIVAEANRSYRTLLFPAYLVLANLTEIILIKRPKGRKVKQ